MISVSALIFILCGPTASCNNYFGKCASEEAAKPEYTKYEREYRKARIFVTCALRGGYIK